MNNGLEIYTKKLGKIPEIQKLRSKPEFWVVGDVYLSGDKLKKFVAQTPSQSVLWIPREDQLKSIFGSKYPMTPKLLTLDLAGFVLRKQYEPQSCEELFLDFLMEKLFQKSWNGEKWVGV